MVVIVLHPGIDSEKTSIGKYLTTHTYLLMDLNEKYSIDALCMSQYKQIEVLTEKNIVLTEALQKIKKLSGSFINHTSMEDITRWALDALK